MFRLTSKITIKSNTKIWVFDHIAGCELTLDSESFTDTCTLSLPEKIKWKNETAFPLQCGNEVTVELGYDDELKTRFIGFIAAIDRKTPIQLVCENQMYSLKEMKTVAKTTKNETLEQLLKDVLPPEVVCKICGEMSVKDYRVEVGTIVNVLGDIKSKHKVNTFFKLTDNKPVLYCGTGYPPFFGKTWVFKNGLNLIKDDTKTRNGVLTGNIETFGVPEVDKCDRIYFQPREGEGANYRVKKVTVKFTIEKDPQKCGYRQTIEIGEKL